MGHAAMTDPLPLFHVCRRAVDFAPAPIPAGARFAACALCGARVVYDLRSERADAMKICFQCADIEPLPIPLES